MFPICVMNLSDHNQQDTKKHSYSSGKKRKYWPKNSLRIGKFLHQIYWVEHHLIFLKNL